MQKHKQILQSPRHSEWHTDGATTCASAEQRSLKPWAPERRVHREVSAVLLSC